MATLGSDDIVEELLYITCILDKLWVHVDLVWVCQFAGHASWARRRVASLAALGSDDIVKELLYITCILDRLWDKFACRM